MLLVHHDQAQIVHGGKNRQARPKHHSGLLAGNDEADDDDVCETSYRDKAGKYQGQLGVTLPRL